MIQLKVRTNSMVKAKVNEGDSVLIGRNSMGIPSIFADTESGVSDEVTAGQITEIMVDGKKVITAEELTDEIAKGYKAVVGKKDDTDPKGRTFFVVIEIEKVAAVVVDTTAELDAAIKFASQFATADQVKARLEYMLQYKVPENLIIAVFKQYRTYRKPVKIPSTLYVDLTPGTKNSIVLRALANALTGNPIDFIGDKSCGKNVCAETIAWLLNKPFYLITFNRQMTPDDVWGSKTTVPSELTLMEDEERQALAMSDIKVSYNLNPTSKDYTDAARWRSLSALAAALSVKQEESELANALQDGGVMVFNEMDMADPNFFSSFTNQITDGTGFIFVPGVGRVKISPNFTLIGTQNDNEAGAESQNGPTLSRFGGIRFSYPDSIVGQLKAATKDFTLESGYYTACEKLYKAFLKAVHSGSVANNCLNIRGFVRALKLVYVSGRTISLKSAIMDHVITLCKPDDVPSLVSHLDNNVEAKL